MAICPKCKKSITSLNNYQSGENYYKLYDDGEYEHEEFLPDWKTNEYECPLCSEVLFTDEEKAKEFLLKKEGEPESFICDRCEMKTGMDECVETIEGQFLCFGCDSARLEELERQ